MGCAPLPSVLHPLCNLCFLAHFCTFYLYVTRKVSVSYKLAVSALIGSDLNKDIDVAFLVKKNKKQNKKKNVVTGFPSVWSPDVAPTQPCHPLPVASLPLCRPWRLQLAQHLLEGVREAGVTETGYPDPWNLLEVLCSAITWLLRITGWSQNTVPGPYLNLNKYLFSE